MTAARKVPEPPLRPGSLFFVPSPLEGWGLDVLLSRLPADSAVVVFEKDPELDHRCRIAFERFLGPSSEDPRLFRLAEDSESAVQALFSKLPLGRLRRCEFLTLNGAWTAHAVRYRQIFDRLDNGLTRWWSNRFTQMHLGPLWIRNLFDNLVSGPRWNPWPDWGDSPVLVCGAGVTLEDALPWAATHRHRLRIVSADTALPVLKAWDLVPDAVVCLEAQHANLRDFAGWAGAPVKLFADLTSHPPGARVFASPPHWFISEFADIELWNRWPWDDAAPRLPALGSVGVAAAWVAWKLSRGTVVLAGLDFSYPAGKTHARGAPSLAGLAGSTDRFHGMEQTGSWVRPGVHRRAVGWLTTPVMEGYAGVLSDQGTAQSHRTWVWSSPGVPLGFPTWPGGPPPEATEGPAPRRVVRGQSTDLWLEEERRRWQRILEAFSAMNAQPGNPAVWTDLAAQLAEVDYLTFGFPDPEFRPDSDWLIRALVQVRWISNRLSRPLLS